MNCPKCNWQGAYIGFNSVECMNPECVHYKPVVVGRRAQEDIDASKKEAATAPGWNHWLSKAKPAGDLLGRQTLRGARVVCTSESKRRVPQYIEGHRVKFDSRTSPLLAFAKKMGKAESAAFHFLEQDLLPMTEEFEVGPEVISKLSIGTIIKGGGHISQVVAIEGTLVKCNIIGVDPNPEE